MDAVRLEQMVAKDGQLTIMGLPFKRGEMVEVIVLPQPERSSRQRSQLTVGHAGLTLLGFGKTGMT